MLNSGKFEIFNHRVQLPMQDNNEINFECELITTVATACRKRRDAR